MNYLNIFFTHLAIIFPVILSVFTIAGWGKIWQARERRKKEEECLTTAKAFTKEKGWANATIEQRVLAPLEVDQSSKHAGTDQESLAGQRAARIAALANTTVAADASGLMEMVRDSDRLAIPFVRWIRDSLVLVALLGTVIGLGNAFSRLADQNPSSNVTTVQLNNLIQQVTPAFQITGWGIGCTVLLSGLVTGYNRKVNRFYDQLDNWTLNDVVPYHLRVPALDSIDRIRMMQEQVQDTVREIADTVKHSTNELNRVINESDNRNSKLHEALLQGAATFSEQVVEAATVLGTTAGTVQSATTKLGETVQRTQSMTSQIVASASTISGAADKFGKSMDAFVDSTKHLPDSLKSLKTSTDTLGGAAKGLVEEQARARTAQIELQTAANTALLNVVKEAEKSVDQVSLLKDSMVKTLDGFNTLSIERDKKLTETGARFEKNAVTMRDELNKQGELLGQETVRLSDKLAEQLVKGTEKALGGVGEKIGKAADDTAKIAARAESLMRDQQDAIAVLKQMVAAQQGTAGTLKQAAQALGALNAMPETLRTVAKNQQSQVGESIRIAQESEIAADNRNRELVRILTERRTSPEPLPNGNGQPTIVRMPPELANAIQQQNQFLQKLEVAINRLSNPWWQFWKRS